MLLLHVGVEAVRHCVKKVFAYAANEAVGLHVLLDALQLITKLSESVDNQTCNQYQGQNYNNNNPINMIIMMIIP